MFSIDSASSIDDASMYGVHAYNSNSKGGGDCDEFIPICHQHPPNISHLENPLH